MGTISALLGRLLPSIPRPGYVECPQCGAFHADNAVYQEHYYAEHADE